MLLGSFIATALIAGSWIIKPSAQSPISNAQPTPIASTPPIVSLPQPSKSPSQVQESPTAAKTPVTPKSPNVISAQPSPIPPTPIITPQPQPSSIPSSPIVTFQPQPSPNYPPTPTPPQPLPIYPPTPTVTLPKPTPISPAQISIKLLDKPELYLASTTLVYSDGDRLKADFRVYCPTFMIRPTNYILTTKQGAVKKVGAWWQTSFTPKDNAEYQLIKEVCNKN